MVSYHDLLHEVIVSNHKTYSPNYDTFQQFIVSNQLNHESEAQLMVSKPWKSAQFMVCAQLYAQ
jgi:hypothetical protein